MAVLDTVATRPEGSSHADGKAYFETSTNQFIVWDATDGEWIQLDSDGTGALAFPNISVFDTEAEILALTNVTDYTIVHAKDTDKLYVWNGSGWVIFNQN